MVSPEATPFAMTGGLGEVLGSLPAALVKRGEQVAVVLPRYRAAQVDPDGRFSYDTPLWVGPHRFQVSFEYVIRNGVRYYFVDCPSLYDRSGIYNEGGVDYADNHIRFALLNQAAIALARNIFRPHIFHCHDWPAGLLPLYLRTNLWGDPTFIGTKCLLTIHNLGYQGNFPSSTVADLGLDPALFNSGGVEFYGRLSMLKAGVVWSDAVNTVSPTYAREIQTPEYGFGFDGLLRSHAAKLSGILNGVDYMVWNPESDPYIPVHYGADDLSGKLACKKELLEELSLSQDQDRPLMAIISRFADQKGMDLVTAIAPQLAADGVALAVLGSGDAYLEDRFLSLSRAHADKVAVRIGYDNGLSHRMEAGSDMFLMPSRYEPCGLNQIYSLRYGTAPIVRATGGLEDTVEEQTGFKFREYSPMALAGAVDTALTAWQDQDSWRERMLRGMAKDFSWNASAGQYQRVYQSLLASKG
jgi:starch synthase